MRRRAWAAPVLFAACAAILLAALAAGLPHTTFVAGDPGVKLIAAREAAAHPSRPFEVDLPRIGATPVPLTDPFFLVHGGHAHATTSALFPLLAAPLVARFGRSEERRV